MFPSTDSSKICCSDFLDMLRDACSFLKLQPKTLYNMIYKREVPYIKLNGKKSGNRIRGGRIRFDPEKIKTWVSDSEVEPLKLKERNIF